jgi:predicted metallopeptidase
MPRLRFHPSPELQELIARVVDVLGLRYIDAGRVYVVFSTGSRSTAYARIWGLPRPFVELGICRPSYVVEIVSENILTLRSCQDIVEVIVHELLHIPRSFSGGLRSHGSWSKRSNIRRVASRIPSDLAWELCEKVKSTAEQLVGRSHG